MAEAKTEHRSTATVYSSLYCSTLYSTLEVLKEFRQIPYKNLKFITIRDPKQDKWTKMDKPRKFLQRYSEKFLIVQSPKGGIHFHALAVLHKPIKFQKGINIRCDDVGGKRNINIPEYDPYTPTSDDIRSAKSLRIKPDYAWIITGQLCHMIKKHFSRIKASAQASASKTKKEKCLMRILNYIEKNYYENTETLYKMYYKNK